MCGTGAEIQEMPPDMDAKHVRFQSPEQATSKSDPNLSSASQPLPRDDR
jgi:hypothetical protein